jgi:hypothetical protein
LGIGLIVYEHLDLVGTQRAEAIDIARPAFIVCDGAYSTFDHPARAIARVVCRTALAGLGTAGKQIPTRQERLHSADPFDVQARVLDQPLDVLDAADVLV